MAYLDDELAAEERHELEAHLAECANCRAQLERERADLSMVRRALVAPPASDVLRARITRALDAEDRANTKRRWSQYMLPVSAMTAAVAAIAVFISVQTPATQKHVQASVVQSAVKVGRGTYPLEVQGASTRPWLQQHFSEDVEPPDGGEGDLLGARLLPGAINGHDAAALSYRFVLAGHPPFVLSVLIVRDVHGDELRDGNPVRVNGRTLYVYQSPQGGDIVSYVPRDGVGFMFMAPELSVDELLGVVSQFKLFSK